MTLAFRNSLLLAAAISAAAVFLFCTGMVFPVFKTQPHTAVFLLYPAFSICFIVYYKKTLKKIAGYELFFYAFFIAAFAFEGLRAAAVTLGSSSFPAAYSEFISKLVFVARFFAVLCFFSVSLYSYGLQFQKAGLLLGLFLVISIALGIFLAVDSGRQGANGLHHLIHEKTIIRGLAALYLISVLNMAAAGIRHSKSEYFIMALSFAAASAAVFVSILFTSVYSALISLLVFFVFAFFFRYLIFKNYYWS